uniref:Putative srp54 n=1 Tax=Corethrella appendiculata TaxID=1370023 RepID=U5EYY3_9DIPT
MAGGGGTKVIQITNIAPQATKDQMQNLFGSIGKIDEIRLYPTIRDVSCPVVSRICYVKYFESSCVAVAQHLTNTVFIDRALIVIPIQGGNIPDEYKALEMSSNGTLVPGLHTDMPTKLPPEVINKIDGMVPNQVVVTIDPKLAANNLPEYPPLPVNFDAKKIEETRRTILILDVKSDWRLEDLMDHFKSAGEVKYARYAENSLQRMAMIEFCEQPSVISALRLQGSDFQGHRLNIHHSTQPITKPEAKSNEAAQKEIEEAMTIVKEAQNMISAAIDPVIGMLAKDKGASRRRTRSRSRSKERNTRSRSRRRSKSRSKRSHSKSIKRSRSRSKRSSSRSYAKRSQSRSKRSKSRSKRSRSRDRDRDRRKRRSRTRSRSRDRDRRKRRSRTRSRSRDRRRRDRRSKSRSHSRDRRDRSRDRNYRRRERSHDRDHRDRKKRSERDRRRERSTSRSKRRTPEKRLKKIVEESVVRDYDAEERLNDENGRGSSQSPKEKSLSPTTEKSDNMDISNSP